MQILRACQVNCVNFQNFRICTVFFLHKKKIKNVKSVITLELLDKTKIQVTAYNKMADFALKNLRINYIIFIYKTLRNREIIVNEMYVVYINM